MINTISNFRAAAKNNGIDLTFSEAAKIMLESRIVNLNTGPSGGYILSDEIRDEVSRSNNGGD